jgi:hypothetical protein
VGKGVEGGRIYKKGVSAGSSSQVKVSIIIKNSAGDARGPGKHGSVV